MKNAGIRKLLSGGIFIILFAVWTWLIQTVDVKPVGVNGTDIGFSAFNCWFHNLYGVNMTLYVITDWLGFVPIFVALSYAVIGLVQLIKRRSFIKVDFDIYILGVYYVLIIICYCVFEIVPINYRPILIGGCMEVSYPSSTTLLCLGVMPTLIEQVNRRCKNIVINKVINILTIIFLVFMVIGRLISGVHWFTDIIGSILLCLGMFYIYKAFVLLYKNRT